MAALNATPILDGGDGINRGLRGWWPLTEAGGNVARDISPYRNEAIQQTGSTKVENGLVGKHRKFDTIGRLRADNFAWPGTSAITVSAWVKGNTSSVNTLFSIGPTSGTDYGKAFVPYLDGNVYWDYNGEGAGRISTSYSGFSDKWINIVLVNNGINWKAIYFNSNLATSGTSVAAGPAATSGIQFGEWNNGYHNNGYFQNFRIWSRALSGPEIRRLYREPWAGTLQGNLRSRKTFYTSGGTTYNDTIADAVTGAESFATTLVAVGAISDATTAAESNATTQTMPNALSDAVTAAEASTASQVMPNPITDDVTGGEAFGTTAVFNSALSDGATASDSVEGSVSSTYNETIADDVTASDAMEGELSTTGGRLRRYRRQIVWDDPPPELAPVVSLAQNYADDLAVERAVDAAIARMNAMSARASMARRARVVEEVKAVILDAIERAAEQDDEDALIALL